LTAFFSCHTKQPCKGKRIAALGLFLLIFAILIYNFQVIPILLPLSQAATATAVTNELQKAIQMATVTSNCYDLIHLTYGKDGAVVALETNSAAIANVSATITQTVCDTLCNKKQKIHIPIGNLSGGALLTGRGPDISIPITVSPQISCEVENEFYECGINQTLHRIVAEIEVTVYIFLPFATKKVPVEAEFCLAETIIVGKVPDAYTKIHRSTDDISESEIDDLYDFGAQAE